MKFLNKSNVNIYYNNPCGNKLFFYK